MRNLTSEEVDKVAGGIAPALVGAMYIATHPATITAAKWGAGGFGLGFTAAAGGKAFDWVWTNLSLK
ncbi:MAG: hypothetical protein EA417_17290 [Gammaproteobacteria bacterium]|nr:MAG: hypothetical protein EA417_17290 [Gammaproteobacteria bacterium]